MALADPQSLTVTGFTGSPFSLPRVSVDETESEYLSNDGVAQLTVSHSYGKRTRRMARIDLSKISADPYKPSENVKVGMAVYTVFDLPPAGFSVAEIVAAYAGLNTQLTASSNAVVTKIIGGES